MKKVFKYPIPRNRSKFGVVLPVGYKFIRVSFQDEQLQMWCEVEDNKRSEQANFQCFGTGHEIPLSATWLATYDDGPFVFHLYSTN